jgi:hypothetical protein
LAMHVCVVVCVGKAAVGSPDNPLGRELLEGEEAARAEEGGHR